MLTVNEYMFTNSLVGKQGIETTLLLEVIEFTALSCYYNILRRYSYERFLSTVLVYMVGYILNAYAYAMVRSNAMKYDDNKDFLIWLLVGLILALLFT